MMKRIFIGWLIMAKDMELKKSKNETKTVKKNQVRTLAMLALFAGAGLFGVYSYLSKSDAELTRPETEQSHFASPMTHVDVETTVLETTQKQLKETEKKAEAMQQQINLLTQDKNTASELIKKAETEIANRIAELEKKYAIPFGQSPSSIAGAPSNQALQGDLLPPPPGAVAASNQYGGGQEWSSGQEVQGAPGIREDNLQLTVNQETEYSAPVKNPDTYVPAGTFAKAVMIGGADASAAVNSQSNPTPMLFRIIANGTLPNHKKSHLKDCIVTAAVVGDISSERGMVRLESLSCTFPNNEVVDQTVEGTIFGSEGKNGIRGIPVWRESALLQRAFVAGTLSGLSDGLSQTYTNNAISPLGNVQTIDSKKIFQYGAAKGAGKAMEKLADYNIQRAEQYHPVIQLSAGAVVDVVFLKGFYLDGKSHETQSRNAGSSASTSTQAPSLFSPPMTNNDSQTLPLSPEKVRRIQEKSKELGLRVTSLPTGS